MQYSQPHLKKIRCLVLAATLGLSIPNICAQSAMYANSGTITVKPGTTLSINGAFKATGASNIKNEGLVTIAGNVVNNSTDACFAEQNGKVKLNGSALQKTSGTSLIEFYDLEVANASGVRLDGSIEVLNNLTMTAGKVDLNGNIIDLDTTGTIINETNANRIFGASGYIEKRQYLNNPSSINIGGMGMTLTAPWNMGAATIRRGHAPQSYTTYQSINRYFDVYAPETEKPNENAPGGTMRMAYFEDELNGIDESAMYLHRSKSHGATADDWGNMEGTNDPANNFMERINFIGFSRWTGFGSVANIPLPVTWLEFTAEANPNQEVDIYWATAMELNNDYFQVQRSSDGFTFEDIERVEAVGTSNERNDYYTVDKNPLQGISYYRIQQIDINGVVSYTDIDRVKFEGDLLVERIHKIYPNPVENNLVNLTIDGYDAGSTLQIEIFNQLGQPIAQTQLGVDDNGSGKLTIKLPSSIAAGIYSLAAYNKNEIAFREHLFIK